MLRSRRTSAWSGALALLLGLGCWVASESGVGASPGKEPGSAKQSHSHPFGAAAKTVGSPHSAASAKSAGASSHADLGIGKHSGFLNKLEHELEREAAEIKRLEQSLESLLDNAEVGNPLPGSYSGSGPISSSGSNPTANQANPSKHHHRHGCMRRGMELARVMHDIACEERTLAHMERNLGRELAGLRDLERNLRNLHTAGQTLCRHHIAEQDRTHNWKTNHPESDSAKSGEHLPRTTRQINAGHIGGQNHADHLHAGSGSPATGHSYALSAARGVGNKVGTQQHRPGKNHH
jgi:hypothetical protein